MQVTNSRGSSLLCIPQEGSCNAAKCLLGKEKNNTEKCAIISAAHCKACTSDSEKILSCSILFL